MPCRIGSHSLYDDMIGGWSFDVGEGTLSPSNTGAVGVVRICLECVDADQVIVAPAFFCIRRCDAIEMHSVATDCVCSQIKELQSSGEWMSGNSAVKVFGVMSERVGKYITMQVR